MVKLSYSPPGVSFYIEDALTKAATEYAKDILNLNDFSMELNINRLGTASYRSVGGRVSGSDIDKIESYFSKNYDTERYVSGSETFLVVTNTVTFSQNSVRMDRAEAENIVRSSMTTPSSFVYSIIETEFLIDKVDDKVIYERFRNPYSYSKLNYDEVVISLPSVCTSKSVLEESLKVSGLNFASFLIIDATEVDRISEDFIVRLVSYIGKKEEEGNLKGVRLRGFSGKHCRFIKNFFRWKENLIVW